MIFGFEELCRWMRNRLEIGITDTVEHAGWVIRYTPQYSNYKRGECPGYVAHRGARQFRYVVKIDDYTDVGYFLLDGKFTAPTEMSPDYQDALARLWLNEATRHEGMYVSYALADRLPRSNGESN